MEQLDLTTPEIIPQISTSNYHVVFLQLDWEQSLILIRLRGTNGELKSFVYGGSNATAADQLIAKNFMIALNKANLSLKSLQRRILERLIADGFIGGTISGVPD